MSLCTFPESDFLKPFWKGVYIIIKVLYYNLLFLNIKLMILMILMKLELNEVELGLR
jgi:hypothetical protein